VAFETELNAFLTTVRGTLTGGGGGEAEESLKTPFESLITAISVGKHIPEAVGQVKLPGVGKPDFAVRLQGALVGHVELKAPGKGADPDNYRGHDADQWQRFKSLQNVLYTDGQEWALYRSGVRKSPLLDLGVNLTTVKASERRKGVSVDSEKAAALQRLLNSFLGWEPQTPGSAKELAGLLAPVCRDLHDDVIDGFATGHPGKTSMEILRDGIGKRLYPSDANSKDKTRLFADAYAQAVTFGILLARVESKKNLATVKDVVDALKGHSHTLLGVLLENLLADSSILAAFDGSLGYLLRIANATDPNKVLSSKTGDPWIYFYEQFLEEYDPELRKKIGAYYTPYQVVRAQVRLAEDVIRNVMGQDDGFMAEEVLTLDPAMGTGTYLVGILEEVIQKAVKAMGAGASEAVANSIRSNLNGIELLAGPFAVAELRIAKVLVAAGSSGGLGLYLGNTLSTPYSTPPGASTLFDRVIAEHEAKILTLKNTVPITVCIGNPPYLRGKKPTSEADNGGWVVLGDQAPTKTKPILDELIDRLDAKDGRYKQNLYNLYTYFWAWAVWKVFTQPGDETPGIISFITPSSYLAGRAFGGLRKLLRENCDDIWIINLGGQGRGAVVEENIFEIKTPVAICMAVRKKGERAGQAQVHYTRFRGSRQEKLDRLDQITDCSSVKWELVAGQDQERFTPPVTGSYKSWPLLQDLMPWQENGVQVKRKWPIGLAKLHLKTRWDALLNRSGQDMADAMKETGARKITSTPEDGIGSGSTLASIASLTPGTSPLRYERYAYRPFDQCWLIADPRVIDRPRPGIWASKGPKQVFGITKFNYPIATGPALLATALVPGVGR